MCDPCNIYSAHIARYTETRAYCKWPAELYAYESDGRRSRVDRHALSVTALDSAVCPASSDEDLPASVHPPGPPHDARDNWSDASTARPDFTNGFSACPQREVVPTAADVDRWSTEEPATTTADDDAGDGDDDFEADSVMGTWDSRPNAHLHPTTATAATSLHPGESLPSADDIRQDDDYFLQTNSAADDVGDDADVAARAATIAGDKRDDERNTRTVRFAEPLPDPGSEPADSERAYSDDGSTGSTPDAADIHYSADTTVVTADRAEGSFNRDSHTPPP